MPGAHPFEYLHTLEKLDDAARDAKDKLNKQKSTTLMYLLNIYCTRNKSNLTPEGEKWLPNNHWVEIVNKRRKYENNTPWQALCLKENTHTNKLAWHMVLKDSKKAELGLTNTNKNTKWDTTAKLRNAAPKIHMRIF